MATPQDESSEDKKETISGAANIDFRKEEIPKEAASEALRKNISDLTEAISGSTFQDIVLACEQKELIQSSFKRNLLDASSTKTIDVKATELVSQMQRNISFQPDCLDTFLCVLTEHGDIPGTTVAEAIAKDYGCTMPIYERSFPRATDGVKTTYSTAKMVVFCCFVLTLLITASIYIYMYYEGSGAVEVDSHQQNYFFKVPPVDSMKIKEATRNISLTLNLEDITVDFNIIAKYLQIAYNGLVIHADLQVEVKDMQVKVLTVFHTSKVAFNDFSQACTKVLSLLESTYFFLYNEEVKRAQENFAHVLVEANKLAYHAQAKKMTFKNKKKRIRIFNLEIKRHKTNRRKDLKNKQEMEVKLRRLEAQEIGTLEKFEVLEELFYDARRRENNAIENRSNPWKELFNGLANWFIGVEIFNMGVYKDVAEGYHKEKVKYFEEWEKVRDIKNEIRADIAELRQRVKNFQTELELSDIAIEALKDVVFALEQVATIMENAMKYWNEIHHVIEDYIMKENKYLELALTDFSKDRNKILYSKSFKEEIKQNYAKWTAIQVICFNLSTHIMEPAITTLQQVVNERPLRETESLAKARQIASELHSDMKYVHKIKDEL